MDIRIEPTYRMRLIYRRNKNRALALSSATVHSGSGRTLSDYKMTVDTLKNRPVHGMRKINTVNRPHQNVSPDIDGERDQKKDRKKRKKSPVKVSSASKLWAVQVISPSENKTTALETIRRRVEAMGYQAIIVEVGRARKVRVGPFGSLAVVRSVLHEMRTNGYPDAFIWRQGKGR